MPSIRGVITDKETGAPLAWVLVTADGYSTTSNTAGRYELKLLPVGTYLIKARTLQYRPWTRKIELTEDIVLDIEMEKAVLKKRACPQLTECPFFDVVMQTQKDVAALKASVDHIRNDVKWGKRLIALVLAGIIAAVLL